MRLLVLGGTAWLGRAVVTAALDAGDEVVCLARGESGAVPDGAALVRGDRADAAAYGALEGGFDGAVDLARHPGHVRGAVAALASRCGFYAFVSSGNVYADHATPRLGIDAPLLEPLESDVMDSMEVYGEAKVACEQAVVAAFGRDGALLARAGLIGGPGDPSGRTTYWPWRFAHPADADGRVLVPDAGARPTQVVDVRDLAGWLVESVREQRSGIANANGDTVALGEHLAVARQVAGHDGPLVPVPSDWLAAHGVQEWMGPRSLPLWLTDPGYGGFQDRDNGSARALGLVSRPLAETLRDGLADASAPPASGLADADERELLAAWASDATGPR